MLYKEVKDILESIGLPFAYYAFTKETAKPAPYICFYYRQRDDLFADNLNYAHIENLVIELYESVKDFELEKSVEDALTQAELAYSKDETYIESEKQVQITYEMEILING